MTAPKLLSTRIPFAGFYESIWSKEIDRAISSQQYGGKTSTTLLLK